MPPTTSIILVRSLRSDLRRISKSIHQRSKRQQISPERTVVNPETTGADTKTDTTAETYTPYSPPPSLHAAILPSSNVVEPSGSGPLGSSQHSSHSLPTGEIIAIAVSIVFAGLLCILVLILTFSQLKSKKIKMALKRVFNRFRPPAKTASLSTPEDSIIDICPRTPSAGGRVQDMVYPDSESEKSDGSIETDISEGPIPPLHVPPSVSSRESAMLGGDDYGIPSKAAFWSRMEDEEVDICLATSIALVGPGSVEMNSMVDLLATRNSWDIRNRARQGSDASESTQETAESSIFSIGTTSCSSKTSVRRGGNSQEDMEIEDDLRTEETTFELARAQTQSVEIKRGILINWDREFGETSCRKFGGSTLPSVLVTSPSSLSSISVDLNEFPLPPDDFVYVHSELMHAAFARQ